MAQHWWEGFGQSETIKHTYYTVASLHVALHCLLLYFCSTGDINANPTWCITRQAAVEGKEAMQLANQVLRTSFFASGNWAKRQLEVDQPMYEKPALTERGLRVLSYKSWCLPSLTELDYFCYAELICTFVLASCNNFHLHVFCVLAWFMCFQLDLHWHFAAFFCHELRT